MALHDDNQLYQNIKELGVIAEDSLDAAFKESQDTNQPLQYVLLDRDLISDENLGKTIANIFEVPYINLTKVNIPPDVLHIIPEIVAKKQRIVAFERTEEGLKVGMNNPKNTEEIEFIKRKTGNNVLVYYATETSVDEALNLYRQALQQAFGEIIKKEHNIANILETLIKYAHQNKASDIHIEPEEDRSVVRFRIDGVLHDVLDLPKTMHDQVITRVKILSKLRTDEHMSAQDGKMQLQLEKEDLDIRVSVVPIVEGEKCVMRLLSARSRQFSLHNLGMGDRDLEKVRNAYEKPHGMILATGPTGSGKTTTIYGILKIVNTRNVNIATIEDPVEYDVDGVNQIQVNPKTNLTFADGLKAILRQDPNIIFVGEIRDAETASIATNAAMTGHLVLSTLHTNDAATTLPRLIDMGIEPFLVASTVNVIIAQRLVRKICENCKVSETINLDVLRKQLSEKYANKFFGDKAEATVYKGKGCEICHHTGYIGRIGVFEILEITPAVRELITQKVDAGTILNKAIEEGMSTMLEDGLDKVTRGVTTIEEVLRVTKE